MWNQKGIRILQSVSFFLLPRKLFLKLGSLLKKMARVLDAQITFNEDDRSFDVEILKSKRLRRMSGMFFIDQDYLFRYRNIGR